MNSKMRLQMWFWALFALIYANYALFLAPELRTTPRCFTKLFEAPRTRRISTIHFTCNKGKKEIIRMLISKSIILWITNGSKSITWQFGLRWVSTVKISHKSHSNLHILIRITEPNNWPPRPPSSSWSRTSTTRFLCSLSVNKSVF